MPFRVASYNILADAYVSPERYPGIPPAFLAPESRRPALIRHITGLGADLICLQEVEPEVFRTLEVALGPRGYQGHYAQKTARPDGCASFVRLATLPLHAVRTLHYADGQGDKPNSGHLGLLLTVRWQGRSLVVANTHLKWDPPGTPTEQCWGYRQMRELLARRSELAPDPGGWVLCGDFNVTSDSPLADTLRQAGWIDVYREREHMRTCNTNREARRIDYLWHTPELTSRPVPLRSILDETTLPSADEPSDHVAIAGWFDWA
jgi:mRNA deadenylase 3'-5' endonuclease subunit Ccr4